MTLDQPMLPCMRKTYGLGDPPPRWSRVDELFGWPSNHVARLVEDLRRRLQPDDYRRAIVLEPQRGGHDFGLSAWLEQSYAYQVTRVQPLLLQDATP